MNPYVKRIVLIVLVLSCLQSITAQESRKVRKAKHKAEQKKELQQNQARAARNKKIEHHFKIQSKATQERMKASSEMTDKHYKKQNKKHFLKDLFNKPRKKYAR